MTARVALIEDAPGRPLRAVRTNPAEFEADRRWRVLQEDVWPHVVTIQQHGPGTWSASCSTCPAKSRRHSGAQGLSKALDEVLTQGRRLLAKAASE